MISLISNSFNNRVLVVDDDPAVIGVYEQILQRQKGTREAGQTVEDLLEMTQPAGVGDREIECIDPATLDSFEVVSASSGQDALEQVENSLQQSRPFAVAFIDVRMPPGWDGLETAQRIRELDDDIYIVFVTAYSDHSVDEMQQVIQKNVLFVPKPFHVEMVRQIARNFCASWMRERELRQSQNRLEDYSRKMAERAQHDGLTGLYNRRYLDKQLELEVRRMRRGGHSLGVLMIDIDWFKRYNDQFGHVCGDNVLRMIATAIFEHANRPADFVARYGGEEFCVVLPNTDPAGTERVGELIRAAVEALKIPFGEREDRFLTVSCGGICRVPLADDGAVSMMADADRNLYQAKEEGKNRVVLEQDAEIDSES